MRQPMILRVHIGRLAVDAAALGTLPREQLAAQVEAALARNLSSSDAPATHGAGL